MPLAVPIPLALGRFKRLPQRAGEVWQGDIVRVPMWVENPTDPDGPPFRPIAALWVSARTGLIHIRLAAPGEDSAPTELALATFLDFGLKGPKGLDGRPGSVEVRDPRLRAALAEPLASIDTLVAQVDDVPLVRHALRDLEARETGMPLPGALESEGMSVDRLRAFAEAAAVFFRARPWEHLTNDDLIVVDSARAPKHMRHISVLGQGGEQFGLAFFDSRGALERMLTGTSGPPSRAYGITFGAVDDLPFADVDTWEAHNLPVAGPRAYPLLADMHRDGSMRRPDGAALTFVEGLLRALAGTTEDELDSGAWQTQVQTFDGPLELRLSLPFLLEAEAGRPPAALSADALPVSAEPAVRRIVKMLEGERFTSLDEVNAAVSRLAASADLDANPAHELTASERAQDLAYSALDAHGRLRIKRARQALALSPECADAWTVLAQEASTGESALALYERAVAAGAATIGAEAFDALRGRFWGHVETRPYMRARLELAGVLRDLGRTDEAVGHYRELLALNPGDNQGVRYLLLTTLLEQDANAEALALIGEYDDDLQALWHYGRVLCHFRLDREAADVRTALEAAVRANPHVPGYLIDDGGVPPVHHFALHSREEAAYAAESLYEAFSATEGAIDWLAREARRVKRVTKRAKPATTNVRRRSPARKRPV